MRRLSHLLAPTVAACVALVACSDTADIGGFHPDSEVPPDTGASCPSCEAGAPDAGSGDARVTRDAAKDAGDAGAEECEADPSLFSVTGSVHYMPTVCDGGAYVWTNPPSGDAGPNTWLRLAFLDKPSVCANGTVRASSMQLGFDVWSEGDSLPPGIYPITESVAKGARASTFALNATCGGDVSHFAIGGMLEIRSASRTEVSGSFSLVFAEGTLNGSFAVPVCGSPQFSLKCIP